MSHAMAPVSITSMPNFDQQEWVIQIRRTLEEEVEDEDIPVSIFNVPKTLLSSKPDVYIPQQVAIGPYHYWRQELYDMERYKLAAAKRTQKRLPSLNFQDLVDQLIKLVPRIRGCYHKYLDFNGETLSWMMAVDLSFLLEYLQTYTIKEGKSLTRVSSRMSHLVDYAGRKSAHNAILRDIVMLENQIPLFTLRKFLELEYSSLELADEVLSSMLIGFGQALSPFNMVDFTCHKILELAHLLDFLYQTIVPKSEGQSEIIEEEDRQISPIEIEREGSLSKSGYVKQAFDEIWKLLSKLNGGPIAFIKKVLFSKPLTLLGKLPWTILTKLPCFSILKIPLNLFFHRGKEDAMPEDSAKIEKPPLVEEMTIPSVTELSKSGVRFLPSHGDIKSISFDPKTRTFHLPTISLDVNAEVVLRNLVAYEASIAPGPLVFTRYTELMNGIIDTDEDVKLLREKGIVLNYLKSDGEVSHLWNGMSKSVRLTRVPSLDKVIIDVNKYYSGRWKIKIRNFVRTYVFGSWKFLTFLAAIFLLVLMTLQAFCSVYSCGRFLRITTTVLPPLTEG